VGVQDAARLWQALVQLGMQVPRGRIRRIGSVEHTRVAGVEQQQIAGAHAREVAAHRVEQELAPVVGHCHAEMVGDRLVQPQPRRPSERGGQIGTGLVVRVAQGLFHGG